MISLSNERVYFCDAWERSNQVKITRDLREVKQINLKRNYLKKTLYLTNQRHLNGVMHQQNAFTGIGPSYTVKK